MYKPFLAAVIGLVVLLSTFTYAENYGGGSGTADDPYQIWTPEQMNLIGANSGDWGKCFKLMDDINMSIYTGEQYKIIGNSTTRFTGTFEGNSKVISYLTITASTQDYVGLFGYVGSDGQIQNLGVENVNITGCYYVGGLVGYTDYCTIISCYTTGSVSGYDNIGGLVGWNNGELTGCYTNGSVSGNYYVGGLVGYNSGPITGCYVTGSVSAGGYVGGLVACNDSGTITLCYATNSINGRWPYSSYIGGLVGRNLSGTITSCYSTGSITGDVCSVGGLVGYNSGMIISCYATGSVSGASYYYTGGLVGYNDSGTIASCYSTGSINGSSIYIGGLVGYNNSGMITSCYATSLVSGREIVGGLAGYNSGTITSCYATGSIGGSGPYDTDTIGGLVGYNNSGTITSCYAKGSVDSYYGGGLVGRYYYGAITSCFWDVQTSALSHSSGGKGLTTEQMKTMSNYQNADWSGKGWVIIEGVDYPHLNWENTGGDEIPSAVLPFCGSGTESDPFLITTDEEFAALSWYSGVLNKNIILTANLDLSNIELHPIGNLGPFTGVFEGNGYIISNVFINQPDNNYVGLFGYIGPAGQIRNLGIENITIQGGTSVGGLAGSNSGTITSCYVTGSISGYYHVGGLVGDNYSGIITSCFATGSVFATVQTAGGLVGYNYSGTITSCYATGSVSATKTEYWSGGIGGLVGDNYVGTITSCYATGSVSGISSVGGLVGINAYSSSTITSCYATGSLSGYDNIGGLAGYNDGLITACLWDIQISGQTTSAGGVGLSTYQMQKLVTYLLYGWDFVGEAGNGTEDIWTICEGMNYPKLVWQVPISDWFCPDGVGPDELLYFSYYWLADNCANQEDCDGVDLNHSGTVDLADWAIFAEQWLEGI